MIVESGEKVGRIEDVLIDTDQLQATDLMLKGDHGHALVALGQIRNIGPDAITIDRNESVRWGADGHHDRPCREASEVMRLTVVDSSGAVVGDVKDIEIDTTSGQVVRLEAESGGVLGIGAKSAAIPAGSIRAVGTELITIDQVPQELE